VFEHVTEYDAVESSPVGAQILDALEGVDLTCDGALTYDFQTLQVSVGSDQAEIWTQLPGGGKSMANPTPDVEHSTTFGRPAGDQLRDFIVVWPPRPTVVHMLRDSAFGILFWWLIHHYPSSRSG
jgi:hypothetical protein|tara:strand:- start:625 stop:999 length:375 start_codon:yes stop_codon:yes gene_type:complete